MITPSEIRKTCQKPRDREETYAWYVTRRISPYVTFLFLKAGLSPNNVTVFTLVLGIVGGLLLVPGYRGLALVGVIILQLMYIFDCADGEMARVTRRFSPEGDYLDKISHYLVDVAVITGLNIGVYTFWGYRIFLFTAVLGAVLVVAHRLILDTGYKTILLKHAENGIPPTHRWSLERTTLRHENKLAIPVSVVHTESKSKIHRLLHGWLRFYPLPGYIYDTPAMMNIVTIAVILDVVFPRSWLMWNIDFRLLTSVFYVLLFLSLFVIRLRMIFKHRVVSAWLEASKPNQNHPEDNI